ncbi:MAG: electron transport complex subunit RsxE [Planctomycetota bacterium]|nr:MAG: electron transport complex subunit RsxE [Planctomycetota bacterium]
MSVFQTLKKGVFENNPVLVLLIGLCPTLATTTSVKNALGMGLATLFVLTMSNVVISMFSRFFPKKIRIPCFIVVIASFVTIVKMIMDAYAPPEINDALGIFIPLIVVNCIILGRAEAFASKNGVLASLFDGLGSGLGFMLALVVLAFFRELLGAGAIFDIPIHTSLKPITMFILAPGAFVALGSILGFVAWRRLRREERECAEAAGKYRAELIITSKNKPE